MYKLIVFSSLEFHHRGGPILDICLQRALYFVRTHGSVQRGHAGENQASCDNGVLDCEKVPLIDIHQGIKVICEEEC